MTRIYLPTEFQPGSAERLRRPILLARGILSFERIWPALWPATGIVGAEIFLALVGGFEPLPWPLHSLILACFVTAIALTIYFNLETFRWPRWDQGARRLESDSKLEHRPISEGEDVLSAGLGDPMAEELWRAHLKARLSALPRLRLALPHSDLPRRDPKALRYGVLLLIVIGFMVAGKDWARRLESIFTPNPGVIATLDAWIDPPAYTGQAPVYLGGQARVSVPAGSVLNLRVHGADHRPSVTLGDVRFDGSKGEYAAAAKLTDSDRIRVRAGGHTIGSWKVTVIPDKPPSIAFADKPSATDRQALKLTYRTGDDYGVTQARAIIRPHNRSGDPLVVDLQLPERSAVPTVMTSFRDLTEHPYAGLEVDITLEAVDAAGNRATSNTVTFRLPQRVFTDQLARALIEQRQILATQGLAGRMGVARALDALTYAPEYFFEGKHGVYLALRMAFRSVQGAATPGDLKRIEDILWQTAVSLEQGGLLTMAEQLRRLQQMILQAMAQGAPQEEIDALLQRYQQMMQQYLSALAQNTPQNGGATDPKAKVLGADDLAALMKAIEQLSQSGDRARAMQLLSMLQSLLENAQVAGGQGGSGNDQASNEALKGLSDVMGRQRMLLDKTFRQSEGRGDPKDGGAKGLSGQQGQLSRDLDALKKKLGKNGATSNLDKAEKLMGEAEKALGLADFPRAGTLQKYALDELRKGAEAMAKAAGQGQNQAQGQDPLGRNTQGQGKSGASDVHIPDAQVLQRARDILMELRKRAGQQGRPKEELDYIDRLLKQF